MLSCEGPYFDVPEEPDNSPPVITITNPPDQATLSDTILISVFAYDDDALKSVTVYLNESTIIDSLAPPSNVQFQYVWDTRDTVYAEDEYHTIYARAEDLSGNINQTNSIQVIIDNDDNVSPTGAFVFPYNNQTVFDTLKIKVEANDNEGVDSVKFYIDDSLFFSDTESPYEYDWDICVFDNS